MCSSVRILGTHLTQMFLWQSRGGQIAKHIGRLHEAQKQWIAIFTKVNINPVFHNLGDDRRESRSRFIVHVRPYPVKHIPLVSDTFPIHFDKLAMDFSRANVFAFNIRVTESAIQSALLVIETSFTTVGNTHSESKASQTQARNNGWVNSLC